MAQSGDDLAPMLEALLSQSQAARLFAWGEGADAHRLGQTGRHCPAELWRALSAGARQLHAACHRSVWALSGAGETPGIPDGGAGIPGAATLNQRCPAWGDGCCRLGCLTGSNHASENG